MIRRAKANFVQDYIDDEGTSSKKFWEKVQYITNSKSQTPQINLVDKITSNPVPPAETPEYVNDFFYKYRSEPSTEKG